VLADLALRDRIRNDVTEGMEKTQREFLLRQQLAAIRKELGEGDGDEADERYRTWLADVDAPDHVKAAVERELGRLERTSEQSPEHGWIRTWLDTVVELPWGSRSDDHLQVAEARAILDADHNGLEDVKDRIVEYLAVRKLRVDRGLAASSERGAGAILALVGPPGVGKTSLVEWRAPWGASSPGCRSAACATKPRSAATAALTSVPCPAVSPAPSRRRAP